MVQIVAHSLLDVLLVFCYHQRLMDTNTLLIIVVVILILGGGGFFYRRR